MQVFYKEVIMERIIDISNKNGKLWAEDEGYLSDFTEEEGYLFSIATGIFNHNTRIIHKDYAHDDNKFKGKYFITLPHDYDSELFCTSNYNSHIEHNITENDYFGDYISKSYQDTIILDMDNMTALCKNEESHIDAVIKECNQERVWQAAHENSFSQPY